MAKQLSPDACAELVRAVEDGLSPFAYEAWQLSDEKYRDDGYVNDPGADEEEAAEEIKLVGELEARLQKLRRRDES